MGSDVLCQAKSGMGKTAVFVLSILQQIKVEFDETTKIAKVGALVMAHTRELAFQVRPHLLQRVSAFFDGAEVHSRSARFPSLCEMNMFAPTDIQ